MTSRELVRKTLSFDSPARIPRQLWLLPWAGIHHAAALARIRESFPDDIVTSPSFLKKELRTFGDEYSPGLFFDEWGCRFESVQAGIIGEVKEPLIAGWKDAGNVRIPEERLSVDVSKVNEFCRRTDRFVLPPMNVRPFERLQFIRMPENLYIDLAEQPDELFLFIQRLHDFFKEEISLWAETEVDGLLIADDWGTQNSLLIAPDLWRRIFKPLYKDYIDIARSKGKPVFMHSDGHIMDILPDLIEMGVDALNSQLFCMDIEEIGRRFKGEITFWGEIDRQRILPYGTGEEVEAAVKRVRDALWQNGGVIAQCEFGIGANPDNVRRVFEAWDRLGPAFSRFR
ncbi:MAG: uroporphyrinogen decarboxylase family protein [Acidobacteriota bacterium]|nr:uroporphyrinogen decarboxylase family protein [Acidobacteriota bacterium]